MTPISSDSDQNFERSTMPDQAPTFERPKSLAEKLPEIFKYHAPTGDQPKKYVMLREKALELAQLIVSETPQCADQTAAIRLLREAVMTANAAISLNGLV